MFLLAWPLGCGNRYNTYFSANPNLLSDIRVVAVLPLDNLTETAEAGEAVSDLLVTELYQLRRFRVLGKVELEQLFAQNKIELPRTIDRAIAAEIGRRIQADGIFIGSVSEYLYRSDNQPNEEEEPAIGINLRLVNSKTGTVVWGSSHARSSYEVFSYEKDALTSVAIKALEEMLKPLKGKEQ